MIPLPGKPFANKAFLSRRTLLLLVLGLLALTAFLFLRPTKGGKTPQSTRVATPLVTVVRAVQRDMNIYLPALGTVSALNTVVVQSRVDGQLMDLLFQEGQLVSQGDLLALIDSRPFEAQLAQAEGQLLRDKALLENARRDLLRYQQLRVGDMIARQQLDTQQALVHQYEGAVKSGQGTVDAARLQITYSRITAPISGRVGLRRVDIGNMMRSSDQQGLAVITQVQPVAVLFSLPEDSITDILQRMGQGHSFQVEAHNREQSEMLAQGTLVSLDNQIDTNTGTLRLKAQFENLDMRLFPNQFVNIRLLVDVVPKAVVLPDSAVQRGPLGVQAYVLEEGKRAALRKVEASSSIRGEVIIYSGISPGERVIVEGAERLRNDMLVEVREEEPVPAPEK